MYKSCTLEKQKPSYNCIKPYCGFSCSIKHWDSLFTFELADRWRAIYYNCNNCSLCNEQCPTQSILLSSNRPYWKFTFESCMKCMNYCPQRAIETAHSMVFLLLLVLIALVNPYLSSMVTDFVAKWMGHSKVAYESLYFVLQWTVALGMFYAGYKLLHYLMRFPGLNKFITYTTLTTWKFWRRYKMPTNVSAHPKGG